MKNKVVTCVALLALGLGAEAGRAQSQPGQTPSTHTFEAASIRVVPDGARVPIDVRFLQGRFVATNVTLEQLIQQAYGIESREVIGGPEWVRADRFNVTATAGESVDRDRMTLMLQSLLAERFQLQVTRDTQTGTVYTLTTRTVHDLRPPAKPSERSLVSLVREDSNGFLSYHYDGHNATMAALAQSLSQQLRAPVVDQTNLTGHYDFRINWTYDAAFYGMEPDPNIPTIFTALENQVGLKLVAGKGPIPVYVITRATKPSPN
jgi:uncharacterized protein (TIGR03435 family)